MFEFLDFVEKEYGELAAFAVTLGLVVTAFLSIFVFLFSVFATNGLTLTLPLFFVTYLFYKWKKGNE